VIPGSERAVHEVIAGLLRRGVRVVSRAHEPKIHASGHAHRGELVRMMELVRPRGFVPVHGTLHHLHRHADLARSQGISDVLVAENGDVIAVDEDPLRKTGRALTGRVFADDRRTVPTEVLDERRKLARAGTGRGRSSGRARRAPTPSVLPCGRSSSGRSAREPRCS
jgi:ribonuclease J